MLADLGEPKVQVAVVVTHVAAISVSCHAVGFIVLQQVRELAVIRGASRAGQNAGDQPRLSVETHVRFVTQILDFLRRHVTIRLGDRARALVNQGGVRIARQSTLLLAPAIGVVVHLSHRVDTVHDLDLAHLDPGGHRLTQHLVRDGLKADPAIRLA